MLRILYIATILFFSLSAVAQQSQEGELYSAYKNYSLYFSQDEILSSDKIKTIFQAISPRYQAYLLNGREKTNEVLQHLIKQSLSVSKNLVKQDSHYETYSSKYSCLLVNGFTEDNKKVALYVKYIKEDKWLIDNLILEHIAEFDDFLKEPICNSIKLQEIRMEAWAK